MILNQYIKQIQDAAPDFDLSALDVSKNPDFDLALPLFKLAVLTKQKPAEIFLAIEQKIANLNIIQELVFLNGFLNIKLNQDKFKADLFKVLVKENVNFPVFKKNNRKYFIDYSSPNVAKFFSVGHLRSTVIGNSLKQILKCAGSEVYGENYLGDWGTQFGKMIYAYENWLDTSEFQKNPLEHLQSLYVRFHKEAEDNPALEDKAREIFKKLEDKTEKYLELWRQFREISIVEFLKVYRTLGVEFENISGESFYNNKMQPVLAKLNEMKILEKDAGAKIVRLGEDIPPALLVRSDGATLYLTRDLTALEYRKKLHNFTDILYVVGNEQKLHFEQLKRLTKIYGIDTNITHVGFGLVLTNGKKMSTREGKTKGLKALLDLAITGAKNIILEKRPETKEIDYLAEKIGVGAIIFNDLKNDRTLDFEFNLNQALKFEGQTGPYIQYTVVRIASILDGQTPDFTKFDSKYLTKDFWPVLKLIDSFKETIEKAAENLMPSTVAKYLLNVCASFNKLYAQTHFIVEDSLVQNANLCFLYFVRLVLEKGLKLLGIYPIDKM